MTTIPPAENQTKDQPVAIDSGFETALHAFWEKNRRLILMACAAALLVIIGREGWGYVSAQREQGVREAYARAADRPEQLKAFAQANAGHALAGVAWLRIADQRYAAADYRQALENYHQAVPALANPALLGRARIGAAMSQLLGGDKPAAEKAFKAVAADTTLPPGFQAEATYHLATLAQADGNAAEAARLVTEIDKIEPAGVWSQRATLLRVSPSAP